MSRSEYLRSWRLKNADQAKKHQQDAYALRKLRFPIIKKPSKLKKDPKRHDRLRLCTPKWLSNDQEKQITQIYDNARKLREVHGLDVEVDHIVPVKGKNVSGLHVPWNLRIIKKEHNRLKGNNI